MLAGSTVSDSNESDKNILERSPLRYGPTLTEVNVDPSKARKSICSTFGSTASVILVPAKA